MKLDVFYFSSFLRTCIQENETANHFGVRGGEEGAHPATHGVAHQAKVAQVQVVGDPADKLQPLGVVVSET